MPVGSAVAFPGLSLDRSEFSLCVTLLTRKLQDIATRTGVPDFVCTDLESTLAALPLFHRKQAAALLERIAAQAEREFPTMAFAARYALKLASEVWHVAPAPILALAGALDRKGSVAL